MERINVHEIWETLDRTGYFSLLLIAAFVLCIYPLTMFSRKHIIKPVDKIKDKMNQVAEGRLDVRINAQERGKGEFAEIADSFNYMVDRLEKLANAASATAQAKQWSARKNGLQNKPEASEVRDLSQDPDARAQAEEALKRMMAMPSKKPGRRW